jgi:hypothetical protein
VLRGPLAGVAGAAVVAAALLACSGDGAGGATGSELGGGGGGGPSTTASTSAGPGAGAGGQPDAPPPEPDFDVLPWETGDDVGFGVARKDGQNPLGNNVFVGYAGYAIDLDAARAWVTALYHASLRDRGVRYVYAVQGPQDPSYSQLEIGNSKIVASLLGQVDAATGFVLVAGHSSGSFVAHELLGQLAGGLDPDDVTAGKVVYFDLDGGQSGLSQPIVGRLRRAYFVAALDGATGTFSPNHDSMTSAGATYAAAGGYLENDSSASGCDPGAQWCVHVTLINTQPHDKSNGGSADYADFVDRPVAHAFIDAKATEAGLVP